jgi:hypothetical protein
MKPFQEFFNEDSVVRSSPLFHKQNKDENIIAAAILDTHTGFVYTGDSHDDAFKAMIKEEHFEYDTDRFYSFRLTDTYKGRYKEGFYTDKNRFLERKEALNFMRNHNRPIAKTDLDARGNPHSFIIQDYLK